MSIQFILSCIVIGGSLGGVSAWYGISMYRAGYKRGKRDSEKQQ